MASPYVFQEAESAFGVGTMDVATTPAFNALTGDLIVACSVCENNSVLNISNNGAALTWVQEQRIDVPAFTENTDWTTYLGADRPALTVTSTQPGFYMHGVNALTWRDTDGAGTSVQAHATGAPSVAITTTQNNSGVVVVVGDWAAVDGASRTWRTVNGAPATELTYFRDSVHYTAYVGYHADVGVIGTYTVGLSAPTGQTYAIVAVEVTNLLNPPSLDQTTMIQYTGAE